MIDVKKLIGGFMVLAAIAAGSALAFSSLGQSNTIKPVATINTVASSPFGQNAFAPSLPDTSNSDWANATSDPNNLTGTLAVTFLNNVVAANPNGPQTDASGTSSFVAPDSQSITAALIKNPAVATLQIPNWDLAAANYNLQIEKTSSPQDVSAYSAALNDIFTKNFVSTNLQSMAGNKSADLNDVSFAETQVGNALESISGLKTPAQLAAFQKDLVKLLVYQKNALALVSASQDDPMKAAIFFQAQANKYQATLADFSQELQKSQSLKSFSLNVGVGLSDEKGALAMLRAVLGIPTAHAQWTVFDPANLGEMIWQWAQTELLQILKNALVNQLENAALKWVQGSGSPRFVQQWTRTFGNVFLTTSNSAVQHIVPNLSTSYGSLVGLSLQSNNFNPNSAGSKIISTLDQGLASLGTSPQSFSQNFNNGGLDAYYQIWKPDNNFYSSMMAASDVAGTSAGSANQSSQAQSVSAQGFTGDQVCADGSDPRNGTHKVCLDDNDVAYYPNPDGSCDPGFFPSLAPNNGVCADGSEPQVTTPGQTTNQSLSSAMGSPVHLIVNANNVIDLLTSLTSSLFNNLIGSALSGGLLGTGSSSNPPPPPPPTPLSCSAPITTITLTNGQAIAYYNAIGGSTANGSLPIYTWIAPGGTLNATSGQAITATYTFPGSYTATVTVSTGGSANCTVTVQ